MYMQKRKIVYKCEIATITYTSLCEYEMYNAYVSILHIYAYMTFTHRIWSLRVLHPPELQSDSC